MEINKLKSKFIKDGSNTDIFESKFELDTNETIYVYLLPDAIFVSKIEWPEISDDIINNDGSRMDEDGDYEMFDTIDLEPYYNDSQYAELVNISLLHFLNEAYKRF